MTAHRGSHRRVSIVLLALGAYGVAAGAGVARAMRRAPLLPSTVGAPF